MYLSPSRSAFICFPIRQAKRGPVLEPGNMFSTSPPSHTSILSRCLYSCAIFSATLLSLTTSLKPSSVLIRFSPQNDLQSLYPEKVILAQYNLKVSTLLDRGLCAGLNLG